MASTRSQKREPLGDVTQTVSNAGVRETVVHFKVDKVEPKDKILVSVLKHTDAGEGPKKKQVQFRPGVPTKPLPPFCVCDPLKSSPLVACEQCSDWHLVTCCTVSGDTENMANVKAVCLPCRHLRILTKLLYRVNHAQPPSQKQAQTICAKLKIPLPLNPTHDDALVHLIVFLLKAPELRTSLCTREITMDEVVVQLESGGVKRGRQGQLELLSTLSLPTLRNACKMVDMEASSSKTETVGKFHSFLIGAAAPLLPLEPTLPRKRAKTKAGQSPATPKPNPRLAAKRRRMLQAFQIAELKQECKSRDLSTSGTREEIVARLVDYLGSQGDGKPHKDCSCDVCDLDNAMLLHSISLPPEFQPR